MKNLRKISTEIVVNTKQTCKIKMKSEYEKILAEQKRKHIFV